MAWPSNITTDNLDADTDSPYLARAEIYAAAVAVNDIIDSRGAADGIAALDGDGLLSAADFPTAITTDAYTPSTGRMSIFGLVNLYPQTTSALTGTTGEVGDVAYCSNGDGGDPCLAVFDGTDWLRVSLGAAISAT